MHESLPEVSTTAESLAPPPEEPSNEDPGKEFLRNGEFDEARESWEGRLKSIRYVLRKLVEENQGETANAVDDHHLDKFSEYKLMEVRTANNLALVFIKLERWNDALTQTKFVLAEDPLNEKALYRQAKALFELARLEEARNVLSTFKTSDPLTNQLRQRVTAAIQHRAKLNKRMIKGIFNPEVETLSWFSRFLKFLNALYAPVRARLSSLKRRLFSVQTLND